MEQGVWPFKVCSFSWALECSWSIFFSSYFLPQLTKPPTLDPWAKPLKYAELTQKCSHLHEAFSGFPSRSKLGQFKNFRVFHSHCHPRRCFFLNVFALPPHSTPAAPSPLMVAWRIPAVTQEPAQALIFCLAATGFPGLCSLLSPLRLYHELLITQLVPSPLDSD